jgi:DNA-binding response OmpR family regulator
MDPTVKILLVEDDLNSINCVLNSMSTVYSLNIAYSRTDALKVLQTENVDLIIVASDLPSGDGLELCDEIKDLNLQKNIPIICIAASNDIEDKLRAFAAGAGDFLTKPFDPRELLARVQIKLRRPSPPRHERQVGDLHLNFERQMASAYRGGVLEELDLTSTEFRILSCLVQNAGRPLNRPQILHFAGNDEQGPTNRSVDVYISSLRRKMRNMHYSIKTVYKAGYSFETFETEPCHENP